MTTGTTAVQLRMCGLAPSLRLATSSAFPSKTAQSLHDLKQNLLLSSLQLSQTLQGTKILANSSRSLDVFVLLS